MSRTKYSDLVLLSEKELFEEIKKINLSMFNLRFKESLNQTFKSHDLKANKHLLSQIKTILKNPAKNIDINTILKSATKIHLPLDFIDIEDIFNKKEV